MSAPGVHELHGGHTRLKMAGVDRPTGGLTSSSGVPRPSGGATSRTISPLHCSTDWVDGSSDIHMGAYFPI